MTRLLFATGLLVVITALFSACGNNQNSTGSANKSGGTAEPTPDKAAIEAQLRALEHDWPRIIKERDGLAVQKLEADDVMLVYPDGSDGTKAADVKDIEAGTLANDPQEIVDVTVNVLDHDSAVVRSRTRVKGDNYKMSDGKCETIIREFRTIDTFVRRNNQWQIVASATVPVRNPAPAAGASPTPGDSVKPSAGESASPARAPSPAR